MFLKVLEDQTATQIESHAIMHGSTALLKLDNNIQCGNSLVDDKFYNFDKNPDHLMDINLFNWETSFPKVFKEKGFSAIIGNPPYIRIQNMMKYSPIEVAYYKSDYSPYTCIKADNFDKYILFVEKSMSLLQPEGILGYIVPNKFFTIKVGRELREYITREKYLSEIIHFGVQQVFKGRLTYTCILILKKQTNETFMVEHVTNLKTWINNGFRNNEQFKSSEISGEPWIFLPPALKELFVRVKNTTINTIKSEADVFVGVQTSSDPIYVVRPLEEKEESVVFQDIAGEKREIEKGILKPLFYKVEFEAFGKPEYNAYAIFPYKSFVENKAILYSKEELEDEFPLCWEYLNMYKGNLMGRKDGKNPFSEDNWFRYGRSQSLAKFNGDPKLVWTTLSLEPKYVYDDQNIMFTGGGNGPYYGLKPKKASKHHLYYFQAVLWYPLTEAILKTGVTSSFKDGYYSHGKQFIDVLPFKIINFEDSREKKIYDRIVTLVSEVTKLTIQNSTTRVPDTKRRLTITISNFKNEIELLLNELYGLSKDDLLIIKELL